MTGNHIQRYTCENCYSNFYTMDSFANHSGSCKDSISVDNKINHLDGKEIKKMTWEATASTGIKIKIETSDGYILSYSLGADGNLVYLNTKDAG